MARGEIGADRFARAALALGTHAALHVAAATAATSAACRLTTAVSAALALGGLRGLAEGGRLQVVRAHEALHEAEHTHAFSHLFRCFPAQGRVRAWHRGKVGMWPQGQGDAPPCAVASARAAHATRARPAPSPRRWS